MPVSKRPTSLRSNITPSKRPRITRSNEKKAQCIASNGETRLVHHSGNPAHSDNSTSEEGEVLDEEDDDEQLPTPDKGYYLGLPGDNNSSTMD